jgi:hypothetical protein
MAQLILTIGKDGIALAADGRAVGIRESGDREIEAVRRIYPLSTHGVVLVGGGPTAADYMGRWADGQRTRQERTLEDRVAEALVEMARLDPAWQREEPANGPFAMAVAGWEMEGERRIPKAYALRRTKEGAAAEPIQQAWTFPRRRVLEDRLKRLVRRETPLAEILQEMRSALKILTWLKEEVGPPHTFALVTHDGFVEIP